MSCTKTLIVFTHTKGRFKGRGTVAIVESCHEGAANYAEEVKNNIEIGHVIGKFRKGKRTGFCSIATEDFQLNGFFDENDLMNGYGIMHYSSKGSMVLI